MTGGLLPGEQAGPVIPEPAAPNRWLTPRALRCHLALIIVVPGCLAAGWFELTRALGGNTLSWVYVFEWPFFAAFACYLWWRMLHEDPGARRQRRRPAAPAPASAPAPATVTAPAPVSTAPADPAAADTAAGGGKPGEKDDPQLRAWNEYLARLHAANPAGGPPPRAPRAPRAGRRKRG